MLESIISDFGKKDFTTLVQKHKDPLFLAATVALSICSCYEHLDLTIVRNSLAGGIISSCSLQILGIAVGKKGIADPKIAPSLTKLLGAINLSYWLMYPTSTITLVSAIASVAFKITTVVFQNMDNSP